jgi:hypothetical protein
VSLKPRAIALVVGLAAGFWIGGCQSDNGTEPVVPPPPPGPPIASDPVLVLPARNLRTSLSPTATPDVDVAYIALPPGSAPDGRTATIRNLRTGDTVAVTVAEGGFDPTPISAVAGDSIQIMVRDAGGSVVLQPILLVVPKRPPVVVRTNPPPKKRDVPLNTRITVVFSEPIDVSTVNASTVQLRAGTQLVAGTLVFRDSDHVAVIFIPNAPLSPSTTYTLEVSGQIRDLDGDLLEPPVTVEFTTASSGGYEEFFVESGAGAVKHWTDDSIRGTLNVRVFDGSGTGIEGVVLRLRVSTGIVEPAVTTTGLGGLANARWAFDGATYPPPLDSIAELSACASNSATRCDMYWPIALVAYNPR